jgi:redox-sensitive bicupin YhaK (pirin superfamily)
VATAGTEVVLHARSDSHVMVSGGEAVGERRLWWNFVATSRERIEQARTDWREGRFGGVPGDDEFIPLPER